MEYPIGLLLSLAVPGLANRIGFDRDPSLLSLRPHRHRLLITSRRKYKGC